MGQYVLRHEVRSMSTQRKRNVSMALRHQASLNWCAGLRLFEGGCLLCWRVDPGCCEQLGRLRAFALEALWMKEGGVEGCLALG